jgi:hypothetical protein
MARAVRPLPERKSRASASQSPREQKSKDFDALREENAQLRELVVQLTKLVMKNIVENKQPVG